MVNSKKSAAESRIIVYEVLQITAHIEPFEKYSNPDCILTNFTPEQVTKAQGGSRGIALFFL
jgi:hypothetical protein